MDAGEQWQRLQRARQETSGSTPLLRGLPLIGQLLAMRSDPFEVLSRAAAQLLGVPGARVFREHFETLPGGT